MTADCCSTADKPTHARLPMHVVPQRYFIDYDVIDLMNYRFEASERIELDVKEATSTITCHAIELCVFDVSIQVPGEGDEKRRLPCKQIVAFPDDETVSFHFAEALPVGATVTLAYRSDYEVDGDKRPLAATQFQPCDARCAFVCWDEPAIKARFNISMVTDTNLTALSNMHVVETEVRPKKNAQLRTKSRTDSTEEKYWKFAESPVMSTYIVAMCIGGFDVLSSRSDEGVVVNVYTPPGKVERGRFSLDVATRALSFFSQQFGIAYPLKKLDMVSNRRFGGAMENWGLVIYGERVLLVDEKLTSSRTSGSYMEHDAVNALFPEWKVWDMFVQQTMMGSAFVKDSMVTSHPIEVEVHHSKEVWEIFDAISYQKGSSVVRMLSDYLGRDVFFRGVHNYLVKFSYKNTKTEDLWDALEEVSGVKITQMANSWTKQTGFPLVTVDISANKELTITQKRFFSDVTEKKDDATLWDVPLTVITASQPNEIKRIGIWDAHTTLAKTVKSTPLASSVSINQSLRAAVPAGEAWFKLNPNQSNYYMVNYPPGLWKQLQESVKSRELDVIDRVSLVSSVFKIATSGVLSVADAFDFTGAYADEPEYMCWKVISNYVQKYSSMFNEEPFYPQFQAYTRELFAKPMKRLTWDPTDEDTVNSNTADFRAMTIARLGDADDRATIEEAHKRFTRYAAGDKTAFSGDLRGPVIRLHVKNTPKEKSRAVVEQLKSLLEASDLVEEKKDLLVGMGAVSDADVKLELIEWAFKNEAMQAMEIINVLGGIASTPGGVHIVWSYLKANYDTIVARFSSMMTGVLVSAVLMRFQREAEAEDVEKFMSTKDTLGYERRLNEALESIRLRSKQFDRDSSVLADWLAQRASTATP